MSAILDDVEPRLRRSFLRMIERVRNSLSQDSIARMIAEGRTSEAEREFEAASKEFAREVSDGYVDAGMDAARFISNALDVVAGFDQFSERAVAYVRENELGLIREFTSEQRDVVREAIQQGVALGQNPIDQARTFRDAIGLTEKQQAAVANYRGALESAHQGAADALSRELRDHRFDSTVRGAASSGEPLSKKQVDAMVDRYRERALKQRAEVIARTEAMRAMNEGMHEAFQQAFDRNDLQKDDVTLTWNTAGDDRVRDSHVAMHNQERPMGEPFQSGLGNLLQFPGDPAAPAADTVQCRCVVSMRIALKAVTRTLEEVAV